MPRNVARSVWDTLKRTHALWRAHRSAEMAAALAFYGAMALAGLALAGAYIAALVMRSHAVPPAAAGTSAHAAGAANWRLIAGLLHRAGRERYAWIALVAGAGAFLIALTGTAFQLQRMIDVIWREARDNPDDKRSAKHHAGQFLVIYALAFVLAILLFAGAGVHGLTTHSHALSTLWWLTYQALDVGVSIALLTVVFLLVFAYLPPRRVPWSIAWPAALAGAVLYERGQFALALYIGQMDARSVYADAGALLALMLWLYYSAQVIIVGAAMTRALNERATLADA